MEFIGVIDMEIKFAIHVIAHKMYNNNWQKNVACEAMDLAYKVVKKDLSFDLFRLQLVQISKNMESI